MAMWYWSVAILFWQLSIDHIVNGQCKRCGFAKTRLRQPSLPFDSLPYPTSTICRRVRTYVRSVSHVTAKRKEVDHLLWVWGSVPRALRARGNHARRNSTVGIWIRMREDVTTWTRDPKNFYSPIHTDWEYTKRNLWFVFMRHDNQTAFIKYLYLFA